MAHGCSEAVSINGHRRVIAEGQLPECKPTFPTMPRTQQICMTMDVVAELQKISTRQSKIKTLKGQLAVFHNISNCQGTVEGQPPEELSNLSDCAGCPAELHDQGCGSTAAED